MPASVSAPKVGRFEAAGYRYRVVAALLDCLVLYTMIILIFWSWLLIAQPQDGTPAAPPLVSALIVVFIGTYVLVTTARGRTMGMRALGLRIVRSDNGAALSPLRVLSRSVVLVVTIGLLLWVDPTLVVVYSLWMLFNTKRRLLHDQITGTVVTRAASSAVNPETSETDGGALPFLGKLDPPQAQALLNDLDQVRRRAQGDLHAASVPLFVLGLLAVGGAVANLSDNFSSPSMLVNLLYWALAGPVGLVVTALWFRRLQRRQGAGTGAGPLVTITILVTCAAVATAFFLLGGVVTAVGFLALAFTQRNRILATAAVIFGLVTGAQQPFHFISNSVINRFPDSSVSGVLEDHGSAIVYAVLGLVLLGVGASAFNRERIG
ncbi:MAG: hypothetical protein QOE58_1637 [Actinomycetota bacterium]|jgi:uncharacterized RDD family membrane protein YckC|nr:hypothetical protein [Actinomycetota bacterium]